MKNLIGTQEEKNSSASMKASKEKNGVTAFVHIFNSFTGSPMMLKYFISCINTNNNKIIITNKSPGALTNLPYKYRYINYSFIPNRKIRTLLFWLYAQIQIFYKLLKVNPDKVVVNTIHPFGAILYSVLFRRQSIAYVHERNFSNQYLTSFLFWIVDLATHKIVVSDTLKGSRTELKDATVIVNCQNIKRKSNTAKLKTLGLVCMGDFEKKGAIMFFKLAENYPDYNFILQTGLDRFNLNNLLSQHDLPRNIQPKTSTSNMQSFYNQIDLLLNLSNPALVIETFGLTIIEAQAAGIPVIGPNVGGPTEIINSGKDGFLVDPTNIKEISACIDQLGSQETYIKYCEAAYQNSLNYTISAYCKRVNQFIGEHQSN